MVVQVPLYWRGRIADYATVDDEDAERVLAHRWAYLRKSNTVYARGPTTVGRALLHRFIMGAAPGEIVDHADGNGRNNTTANLRIATPTQSVGNTCKPRGAKSSRFKGVYWKNSKQRWIARMEVDGRDRQIGQFVLETDAAHAYDEAARQRWGAFACVNFPRDGERGAIKWNEPTPERTAPKRRSLPRGVSMVEHRYQARHKGKSLGCYATAEEAAQAYQQHLMYTSVYCCS